MGKIKEANRRAFIDAMNRKDHIKYLDECFYGESVFNIYEKLENAPGQRWADSTARKSIRHTQEKNKDKTKYTAIDDQCQHEWKEFPLFTSCVTECVKCGQKQ